MISHPSLDLLSHCLNRENLFLVVYCIVDDWMKMHFDCSNAPRSHRGPKPDEFSDSEVLAVLLVGELCHAQREAAWLRQVRANHLALFPRLPEDSRFSRRAQQARHLLVELRRSLLFWADADLEPMRIFDSFPMPLCACYRIRQSTQPISGSTFGYNDSKRCWYFGLRPGLLVTASGFIEDLVLSPGNCNDTPLLARYLDECVEQGRNLSGQDWLMDKGFINAKIGRWAKEHLNLNLLVRQRDKAHQEPAFWQVLIEKTRKPIENILSVLCECFGIEHLLARTDIGLYRRAQAKATAFCMARYFNLVLRGQPMNIARYAV